MPYEIVHTIGSTVYFVFFLLFLWVRRTPRINPGAGWWAGAMLFALASRPVLVVLLAAAAWIAWTRRDQLDRRLLTITAVSSGLLALHWAFAIIERVPGWFVYGFLLGALLVLVQYFSLLAAVLRSFQKHLLEAESKALDMAFQDPLTGLSNQRYMRTLFENALVLAHRPHQLAAVIYIDVDNFKPVNDRAGHRVGDEVLKTLAARLRQSTRSTDICARIGGDEFVVICTQLEDAEYAHGIAQKLLREFTAPLRVEGREYVLGASIGVSLYPLHGDLLECVDRAMYQIKGGKNGYRIHAAEVPA